MMPITRATASVRKSVARCPVCGVVYDPRQYTGGFHCVLLEKEFIVTKQMCKQCGVRAENRRLKRLLAEVLKAAKEIEP